MTNRLPRYSVAALLVASALSIGGCDMLAGLLGASGQAQGRTVASQYDGLPNKSLAIVIYAPGATLNEYTGTREELTGFVTTQMRLHLPTTHLLARDEVINWQNDHLNWYALADRDIGKHFTVDRVLYIEVLDYSTRKTIGYGDMQGHLRARCKIANSETGETRTTPEWTGIIDVSWPPDHPLDPTQTNESAVRIRLLENFSQRLVECFYEHKTFNRDMPG